jgi:spoIIIJ-associated protein
MESIEMKGKTVEIAVDAAIEQLGVGRDNVDIEVLDEGHSGLFGIGGSPASVRVTVKSDQTEVPDEIDTTTEIDAINTADEGAGPKDVLEKMLDLMNIDGAVKQTEDDEDIYLDIDSPDAAVLIGRRGKCLNSLQFIMNRMVRRQDRNDKRLVVDIEGYRERRRKSLTEMAEHTAEKVCDSGREVRLQPLDPQDRRTVHIALREYPGVDTYSVGEGSYRSVVVCPEGASRTREHRSRDH